MPPVQQPVSIWNIGDTWTHLLNNLIVFSVLGAIDHLVLTPALIRWMKKHDGAALAGNGGDAKKTAEAYPVPSSAPRMNNRPKDISTTRWFLLHSVANFFVCVTAVNSIRTVLADPVHALDAVKYSDHSVFGSASVWPLTIINSVHVYHMLGGFKLSSADYFHHLLFIPTLGFPGQVFCWGPLANWQAFFISGLPGGIDYLLLGLAKLGLVDPLDEKRVNGNLNTWLRQPGILVATVLLYQAMLLDLYFVPRWAAAVQLVLPAYNACYFGKQAVANYAVHYMLHLLGQDELIRKHIEQRTSYSTGEEVMAWKDALGVPQRGS